MTIEEAREKAAQLWCEPQHAHKEMDVDFAESIAQLLVRETERAEQGSKISSYYVRDLWS